MFRKGRTLLTASSHTFLSDVVASLRASIPNLTKLDDGKTTSGDASAPGEAAPKSQATDPVATGEKKRLASISKYVKQSPFYARIIAETSAAGSTDPPSSPLDSMRHLQNILCLTGVMCPLNDAVNLCPDLSAEALASIRTASGAGQAAADAASSLFYVPSEDAVADWSTEGFLRRGFHSINSNWSAVSLVATRLGWPATEAVMASYLGKFERLGLIQFATHHTSGDTHAYKPVSGDVLLSKAPGAVLFVRRTLDADQSIPDCLRLLGDAAVQPPKKGQRHHVETTYFAPGSLNSVLRSLTLLRGAASAAGAANPLKDAVSKVEPTRQAKLILGGQVVLNKQVGGPASAPAAAAVDAAAAAVQAQAPAEGGGTDGPAQGRPAAAAEGDSATISARHDLQASGQMMLRVQHLLSNPGISSADRKMLVDKLTVLRELREQLREQLQQKLRVPGGAPKTAPAAVHSAGAASAASAANPSHATPQKEEAAVVSQQQLRERLRSIDLKIASGELDQKHVQRRMARTPRDQSLLPRLKAGRLHLLRLTTERAQVVAEMEAAGIAAAKRSSAVPPAEASMQQQLQAALLAQSLEEGPSDGAAQTSKTGGATTPAQQEILRLLASPPSPGKRLSDNLNVLTPLIVNLTRMGRVSPLTKSEKQLCLDRCQLIKKHIKKNMRNRRERDILHRAESAIRHFLQLGTTNAAPSRPLPAPGVAAGLVPPRRSAAAPPAAAEVLDGEETIVV